MGGINPPTHQKTTYQKGINTMPSNHSNLMQEVETYGNGLLSEDTIARTVDILMECDLENRYVIRRIIK